MLNERAMRQALTTLGAGQARSWSLRDAETGAEKRRLAGEELRRVIELLEKLEELVKVIQRRGIDFAEFLGRREERTGRLPLYRTVVEGEEKFHYSADDRDEYLREKNLVVEDADMSQAVAPAGAEGQAAVGDNGDKEYQRLQKNQELHEVKELEKLFASSSSTACRSTTIT